MRQATFTLRLTFSDDLPAGPATVAALAGNVHAALTLHVESGPGLVPADCDHAVTELIEVEFAAADNPPGHVIPAEAWTADGAVRVRFCAASYFKTASAADLVRLAEGNFGYCAEADNVALHFAKGATRALFGYALSNNVMYECNVEREAALRWLADRRPDVHALLESQQTWDF